MAGIACGIRGLRMDAPDSPPLKRCEFIVRAPHNTGQVHRDDGLVVCSTVLCDPFLVFERIVRARDLLIDRFSVFTQPDDRIVSFQIDRDDLQHVAVPELPPIACVHSLLIVFDDHCRFLVHRIDCITPILGILLVLVTVDAIRPDMLRIRHQFIGCAVM